MLKRLLAALGLLAVSAAGGEAFLLRVYGSSPALAQDAFKALLATIPHDSWQQLNAASGNGQPYNLLKIYDPYGTGAGFTMCNYDGSPPASCPGGSGSGDAWSRDADVAAGVSTTGAGGADPYNSRLMFVYSAPAIRQSDGKICGIGNGCHAGSLTSAVFCFDTQAAAAPWVAVAEVATREAVRAVPVMAEAMAVAGAAMPLAAPTVLVGPAHWHHRDQISLI